MSNTLTEIIADLIIAESSVDIIITGGKAKTGDPDYMNREALHKYGKRVRPVITQTIKYLEEIKARVKANKEKESANGGEKEN